MDMSNEILEAVMPQIKSLESLYTNIFRSELQKIAGEYEDNPDEQIATQQVINSVQAVITSEGTSLKMEFKTANDPWFEIMNEGMEAPEVTGGEIALPQGGTRESHAAVTGGVFYEGAEPDSMGAENAMKMIRSLFPEDVKEIITGDELVKTIISGRLSEEIQKALGGGAS